MGNCKREALFIGNAKIICRILSTVKQRKIREILILPFIPLECSVSGVFYHAVKLGLLRYLLRILCFCYVSYKTIETGDRHPSKLLLIFFHTENTKQKNWYENFFSSYQKSFLFPYKNVKYDYW